MAYIGLLIVSCTVGFISGQVGIGRVGNRRVVGTGGVGTGVVGTGVVGTGGVGTVGVGTGIGSVIYDLNTQAKCTEVERTQTKDCRWVSGLNMVDQIIEKGRIAAYKIILSTGLWSEWYVPGVNDLDTTFNQAAATTCAIPYRANTMRRMWAYFYDRSHRYIICKPQ